MDRGLLSWEGGQLLAHKDLRLTLNANGKGGASGQRSDKGERKGEAAMSRVTR